MVEPVMVPVEDLVLPEAIVDEFYVQRLVEKWDPALMGPIYAKKQRDGKYLVTDGIHRAVAASKVGAKSVKVMPRA